MFTARAWSCDVFHNAARSTTPLEPIGARPGRSAPRAVSWLTAGDPFAAYDSGMSSYRIIRSITPLAPEGFVCTVMGVREDPAGHNEFEVRVCATVMEANLAADTLEEEIRGRIASRGERVSGTRDPETA